MKKLLLALFACSAPAFAVEAQKGLDVNDVAVLFPLDANKQPFPKISLKGPAQNQELLKREPIDAVLKVDETLGIKPPPESSLKSRGDWVIVGFRYDPCAPAGHNTPTMEGCAPEFRLVAQPASKFGPADSALHLLYKVGEGDVPANDPLIADLFATKTAAEKLTGKTTSGRPLDVHPLLVEAQAKSIAGVTNLYENLVRKYAKPENLKKLTMMGVKDGSQTHWIFFGGDVVNGVWSQGSIPNLPVGNDKVVELNLNSPTLLFSPKPNSIAEATFGFFHRELLAEGDIEALREETHKIENPQLFNRNTVDCVSCHSSTSIRMSYDSRVDFYYEGSTAEVPTGITAFPAPKLLQKHRRHWNMRAFGYFGIIPTLSARSVTEAGRVAAKVNSIVSLPNPGPNCSLVIKEVVTCFANTTANLMAGGNATSEECLKSCLAP